MSGEVLQFRPRAVSTDVLPKAVKADGAPSAPIPMPPSKGEQIIPKKVPVIRDPRARVEMPLSVLEEMTDTLIFYSRQGFDHGVRATRALSVFTPPQQPSGDVA